MKKARVKLAINLIAIAGFLAVFVLLAKRQNDEARVNFYAALVQISRDAERGEFLLYSVVGGEFSKSDQGSGRVRVVHVPEIADIYSIGRGNFVGHYNNLMFSWIAAHARGEPAVLKDVVAIMQTHAPDFLWFGPAETLTIHEVANRLENDPHFLAEFIDHEERQWRFQSELVNWSR